MAIGRTMKRVFVTAFLVLVFGAFWQSLAVYLPFWLNLFFTPPIVLVFSLQFFRTLETIVLCLVCGLCADILGGLMVGSNMLFMLCAAFILSASNIISGRIYNEEQIYYVMATSFLYSIIVLIAHLIFLQTKANVFFLQLLLGPIVDGVMSIIFYKFLLKALISTKAIDQSDYFKDRIGFYR
jgi:hypothetical protein